MVIRYPINFIKSQLYLLVIVKNDCARLNIYMRYYKLTSDKNIGTG